MDMHVVHMHVVVGKYRPSIQKKPGLGFLVVLYTGKQQMMGKKSDENNSKTLGEKGLFGSYQVYTYYDPPEYKHPKNS